MDEVTGRGPPHPVSMTSHDSASLPPSPQYHVHNPPSYPFPVCVLYPRSPTPSTFPAPRPVCRLVVPKSLVSGQ